MTDIALPTDDRPSRIRRTVTPAAPIPVDDVAQTLAEYTRVALSTGARLEIDPVEFTADGETWVPLWLNEEPPAGARATVRRDGVETIVIRRWVEALPGEEALTDTGRRWMDIWLENQTERFESYVLRAALARAYPDVIGDRFDMGKPRVPRPVPTEPAEGEPAPPVTPEQAAEVDAAVAALPWEPAPAGPVPRPPSAHIPRLHGGAA
ncbi:hypothetical protein [Microbacterium sp. Leaf436]|uniref:hypothetical protein n=1 Tax=Microbacterium sp. Leaf436 TaxID=1736377 RepID=UPI0006F454D8|nr:hypothetical protein [Microbacterium sp. Leaf436]KQT75381.1 hypothetical protein ASG45_02455 [Microbacterium sp. Leaf436]